MNDIKIGEKRSFWSLLNEDNKNNILIPTIQRDYTYGANTEETNKVLNSMLSNMKAALFDPNEPEMTMNFVYGFTQDKVNYVPLDGQQRLTTLFLLHYYAALFHENAEIDLLRKFSYATRETTKNYCNEIIDNWRDICKDFQQNKDLAQSIHNMPWFLPNYDNDPSIRSMQFVLNRINDIFSGVKDLLWDKLTSVDCPVNFYRLDFGPFGLSDDLYVKMNSRGKKLTEYEIFKSSLLKHLEKNLNNKSLERDIAIKLDNQWTDLVWQTWMTWHDTQEKIEKLSLEDELRRVDDAYVNLMKFILKLLSCKYLHCNGISSGNENRHANYNENPTLDSNSIKSYFDKEEYVLFAENVLDVFYETMHKFGSIDKRISEITDGLKNIVKDCYGFKNCLGGKNLNMSDLLFVYGEYLAFKSLIDGADISDIRINLRHLRNILANSDDEIRKENMPKLIEEVELILNGQIKKDDKVVFNSTQWNEEAEKHTHIDLWRQLWKYEEHDLLRGALSNFWDGQFPDFSSQETIDVVKQRLDKFMFIFGDNDTLKYNDRLIRAALLTVADYSQSPLNRNGFKILGNNAGCWRPMFTKSRKRVHQSAIIKVMDAIDIPTRTDVRDTLTSMISQYLNSPETDKTDWRYYMIKYKDFAYRSNSNNANYGYFYIDPNYPNPLDIVQLNSREFGTSNLAWYFLPQILKEKNQDFYNLYLADHAGNEDEGDIVFYVNSHECKLNIQFQSWGIWGLPLSEAESLGIPCKRAEEGNDIGLLCTPEQGEDFIEFAEKNILAPLSKVDGFAK